MSPSIAAVGCPDAARDRVVQCIRVTPVPEPRSPGRHPSIAHPCPLARRHQMKRMFATGSSSCSLSPVVRPGKASPPGPLPRLSRGRLRHRGSRCLTGRRRPVRAAGLSSDLGGPLRGVHRRGAADRGRCPVHRRRGLWRVGRLRRTARHPGADRRLRVCRRSSSCTVARSLPRAPLPRWVSSRDRSSWRGRLPGLVSQRRDRRNPVTDSIEDVTCAVRYARSVTEQYGGDPARVVLVGHSYGSELALSTAVSAETETPTVSPRATDDPRRRSA